MCKPRGWWGVVLVVAFSLAGGTAGRAARAVDPATWVILVEPTAALDAQRQKLKAEGRLSDDNLPVYRPFVGNLVEVLAVDNGSGYEVPQRWMLTKLFRSGEDRIWNRARSNIGGIAQPVALLPGRDGMTTITAQNGLAPSILLYDPLWSKAALVGEGEIVVAVDSRALIVGHTDNPGQIRELRALVRLGAGSSSLIGKTLIVRRGGRWAAYP